MLGNFKIPVMSPVLDGQGLTRYLRGIFSRWSNSDLVKFRVITIGEWDMDITDSVTISYGQDINIKQIVNIFVSIINDAGDKKYSGNLLGDEITVDEITTTSVKINRKLGGFFDSVDFSSTAISRGEVTICHLS